MTSAELAIRPSPRGPAPGERAAVPDLAEVRDFWNANPLYAGESRFPVGSRDFFDAHRRMTLAEHSGTLDPIFLRDIESGRRVLDVGCGIGFWVEVFARRGAQVSACDLTETAVALTRRRAEVFDLPVEVRVGNAEDLPYESESFDHVNCQGVIHHTPNAARCIEEFHRVLRPGGTLSVSVYYRSHLLRSPLLFRAATTLARPIVRLPGRGRERMLWAASPEELVRMYDGADNPLGRAFTVAEVRAMLEPYFVVSEQRRLGFPRRALPLAVPDGTHRLLGRMLGLMMVFRAHKRSNRPCARGRPLPAGGEAGRTAEAS